jgi:hypothetical protein
MFVISYSMFWLIKSIYSHLYANIPALTSSYILEYCILLICSANIYEKKKVCPPLRLNSAPWSESAGKLYRPSDRRLLAK